MNSFELNKVLGAMLGTCLVLLALNIARRRDIRARKAGQARLRHRGQGRRHQGAAPRRRKCRSRRCSPRRRWKRASPPPGSARPATLSRRAAPTASAPTSTASSAASAPATRGFNFSAAMKAKGGNWTFDELNKFLAGPREYIPGTAMTFAGLTRDTQRADVIDYLHTLSDNPCPAAQGGGAERSQTGRGEAGRSQAGRSQAGRSRAGRSQAG